MKKKMTMKKILKYIWALPVLMLASCAEEMVPEQEELIEDGTIISVSMAEPQTRVEMNDGFSGLLTWKGDEEIRLYKQHVMGGKEPNNFTTFKMVGKPDGAKASFIGTLPAGMSDRYWFTIQNKGANEEAFEGNRPVLSKPMTQNGNNSTAHLNGKFHMAVNCTGEELMRGVTLQPLCCLATFEIEEYPRDMIGNLNSLTWIVNSNKSEQKFERKMTLAEIQPGKITAYMLFYPDEAQLAAGGEMRVVLKGSNGAASVSVTSEAGKTYVNGGRYTVKISLESKTGYLYNWAPVQEEVVAQNSEFIVKAGTQPTIPTELTNWTISKVEGKSGYYSVAYQENGASTAITAIPANMFKGFCGDFTEIYFPDGLVSIGASAFDGCNNLVKIVFPKNSLKKIEANAFSGCSSLMELNLPEGVTIGSLSFHEFQGSEQKSGPSLSLPRNTTLNGEYAFGSSSFLTSLTISEGCNLCASSFFQYYHLESVTVEQNAAVTLAANSFAQCTIKVFNFYGGVGSSLASGFVDAGTAKRTNLKLNVDWLTQAGDDPWGGSNSGVLADTRTPKQVKDEAGKVIGGTWMGVDWKSITFVNPDGTPITDLSGHPDLKGSAVWGNPDGTVPEPTPSPVLSLSEAQKQVAAAAAELSFTFSVSNPTEAQPAVETTASWIKNLQVTSLVNGNATVTYSVEANESETPRNGIITVKYEGAQNASYTVKQSGKAAVVVPDPVLSLAEDHKDIEETEATGLSFTVSVANPTAAQPTVETAASWIKNVQITTLTSGSATVTYDVDANPSETVRNGIITVKYEGAQNVTYTVNQAAKVVVPEPSKLKSATFDNDGILVEMPKQARNGITYEALVNFSSFNANNTVIGQEEVFLLRVGDSGKDNNQIHICFDNLDAKGEATYKKGSLLSNARLNANQWYHLAATIKPSGSGVEVALYVNGTLDKSQVFDGIAMPEVGGDGKALDTDNYHGTTENFNAKRGIFIGRLVDYKWNDRPMNGMMREARVWSVARTAEQIKANMLTVDASSEGLEAYYKFDGSDIAGTTVNDASGKNHNGTVKAGTITITEHDPIVL